jgi:phosphate transport system permease protein
MTVTSVGPPTTNVPSTPEGPEDDPRRIRERRPLSDRVFRGIARAGGTVVLAVMLLVGVFLTRDALPAWREAGLGFLTTQAWDPQGGDFGVAGVLVGTLLIGMVAISVAVPLAFGAALYISEYAPARIKPVLINMVDLMAAVPSVVYGIWGLFLLQPKIMVVGEQGEGLPRWLATYFGWIPLFQVDDYDPRDPLASPTSLTASTFMAGLVVSMMVTPIIASIMREVFSQAPLGEREGAFALGATRWGMIRSVVLPFGRGGMVGGTMLGLGRALGETIAVTLIISPTFDMNRLPHILETGGNSISSLIALRFSESNQFGISALMAAGLVLFCSTLIVNSIASVIVSRSRSGAATEI